MAATCTWDGEASSVLTEVPGRKDKQTPARPSESDHGFLGTCRQPLGGFRSRVGTRCGRPFAGCAAFVGHALAGCPRAGGHLLIRARSQIKVRTVRTLKDGSRYVLEPMRQKGNPRLFNSAQAGSLLSTCRKAAGRRLGAIDQESIADGRSPLQDCPVYYRKALGLGSPVSPCNPDPNATRSLRIMRA